MADYDNDRWNNDNRRAGEADYGQRQDRSRGYREGRFADDRNTRYDEDRSYGGDDHRQRSHPLRGAPRVNQDIGYGSGSMATGGYAGTRAPGSFSDYGAGSSGGYGDGYGYSPRVDQRSFENRSYERDERGYRANDRYDSRFGGQNGPFATDDILDRQARGDEPGFFSRMFGRDRDQGEHRGRGPKNYKRSDERIRDDVNDRLTDDSWLDAQHIDVEVKDREVTLTGTVRSRDDKRRAETLAENVSGVDHVQNNLRVRREDEDVNSLGDLPPVPLA